MKSCTPYGVWLPGQLNALALAYGPLYHGFLACMHVTTLRVQNPIHPTTTVQLPIYIPTTTYNYLQLLLVK